jgi:hypothetical protein
MWGDDWIWERRREGMRGLGKRKEGEGKSTSAAVTPKAAQSTLGRTLYINFGFSSMVSETSSHSFGWRGKEAEVDLQALTAQVRKLRVRTFIFEEPNGGELIERVSRGFEVREGLVRWVCCGEERLQGKLFLWRSR